MDNNGETTNMKIMLVGDGAVGKTCVINTYIEGSFPTEYKPTVCTNYIESDGFKGEYFNFTFSIGDSAGQEDYDRLRPLEYPMATVFVLCYNVVNIASFENILAKWFPEVIYYKGDKPIILAGLKVDMRKDRPSDSVVTKAEGKIMASKIGAKGFFECSALRQTGIEELFRGAAKSAVHYHLNKQNKRTRCCILI